MDFRCDATGDDFIQRLERRSLLLMYGDARSIWRHGIAKRRTDVWNDQKVQRCRVAHPFTSDVDSRWARRSVWSSRIS